MESSADRPVEPEKRRHALTVVGAEYAGMAREATGDLPSWFRPIAMVFIYAYGLLMTILMAPAALVMIPKLKSYLRLYRAVSSHVQRVWREESPEAAMAIAQRVLHELERAYPRRVRIPTYGAASSKWALDPVGRLVYSGHVALADWRSALGVAEEILEVAGDDAHWEWKIFKAKGLWHTGHRSEARAILQDQLPLENAGPEARRLLDSWEVQDQDP